MWLVYALLSALFAALTAIFGKLGVANVNSNLATGIRTVVILIMIWSIVMARGEAKGISTLSKQNITFLIISGIATGLSWLFYFKALQLGKVSQVAAVDKLSVALTIIIAVLFLGEQLTLKHLQEQVLSLSEPYYWLGSNAFVLFSISPKSELSKSRMEKFYNETLEKLETDIKELEMEADSSIQQVETVIRLIIKCLANVKEYVLNKGFKNTDEEIRFFKYQKPVMVSKLIYYNTIYKIETKKPYGAKPIRNYLNNELKKLIDQFY